MALILDIILWPLVIGVFLVASLIVALNDYNRKMEKYRVRLARQAARRGRR